MQTDHSISLRQSSFSEGGPNFTHIHLLRVSFGSLFSGLGTSFLRVCLVKKKKQQKHDNIWNFVNNQ